MKESDNSGTSKYLIYIAYLQVIGIILVVAGHSVHMYPDGQLGTRTLFYRALYSFHMPLFLFVSGFLMIFTSRITSSPRHSPGPYIIGKLRRLILPFVTLTAVTFFPRAMMSGMADDVIEMNTYSFAMSFIDASYMPIPYFWYLQACFLLLTVSYCILFFGSKAGIPVKFLVTAMFVAMLVFSIVPLDVTTVLSLHKIRDLGLYFMLGVMYGVFANDIDRFLPWTQPWFTVMLAVAWGVAFFLFERTDWMIICAIFGIMMCISVARILEQREWQFLEHLTGANYLIFLLSWYCNVAAQQVLSHLIALPWWVYSVLSLITGIYIPWLGYRYLQRHSDSRWIRFTAFLLGQKVRKPGSSENRQE